MPHNLERWPGHCGPSWRRRKPMRLAGRTRYRDDDGLFRARRIGHGDAMWQSGLRRHPVFEPPGPQLRRHRERAVSPFRTAGCLRPGAEIRELLESKEPAALEAIESFNYRIATQVGSLVVALGGLDGLVFTAGIGQHSPVIRKLVCDRWLGSAFTSTTQPTKPTCHASARRTAPSRSVSLPRTRRL